MDRLFNIFQREKKRVGDRFTVYYDKERKAMRYSNSEGTLTVMFDEENGSEDFYYKFAGENRGLLIQQLIDYGHRGVFSSEIFRLLSQEVINLMSDYRFNRKLIGVEKPSEDKKAQAATEKYCFKGAKILPPITPEYIKEVIENYEENKAIDEAIARGEISEEDVIDEKNVTYYFNGKKFP